MKSPLGSPAHFQITGPLTGAVADAGVTVKRTGGRPLLGEFKFNLHHYASPPVARELGVQSQVTRLALESEMEFVLNDGQVLWQGAPS